MSKVVTFITVNETAKILGITLHQAYELGYSQKIGRYVNKHGGVGVRYNRAEVLEFKAEHGVIVRKPKKAKKKKSSLRPSIAKMTSKNKPKNVPYPSTGNSVADKLLGGNSHVSNITPKLPDTKTTPMAKSNSVVTMVTPNGCKIIGNIADVANFYNQIK